jgi:hypothetical protein
VPKPPEKGKKEKNPLRQAAILSGIAVEMGVIIYLAAQAGLWLDAHFQTGKKLFTALCTILGVGISLWVVLKQLKRLDP